MKFLADLHIHSRFSRATAKTLDFGNLYVAAQKKGITVVGTGDFTHPAWFGEINDRLTPAEEGLFVLKDDISRVCDEQVPKACRQKVRFLLVTEISNIYKKQDKTRKNHNLVFMPDLESASRFNETLAAIGNVQSDGRPILGLDARDLLEIVLDISDRAFLVPAHIWTPWFSLLGSKSGFDSIKACFDDLTPYIFAAETGLSSDPAMNWRVSGLDNITLISNSDAHSPMNMGREANLFDTALNYDAIKEALKTGDTDKFLGTIEFYPEEGKYHFDGHRKCHICFHPDVTTENKGICPVCQKPLTLGVLYRVKSLADRAEGEKPKRHHPYYNMIPLVEILSELLRVGPKSKKVQKQYATLLKDLGSEFNILKTLSVSSIERAGVPLLAEAISRMRIGNVIVSGGYDGEYGKITLFKPEERDQLLGQKKLFKINTPSQSARIKENLTRDFVIKNHPQSPSPEREEKNENLSDLNPAQLKAVKHQKGPLMVVAGPGTGKTRTLTRRIAYLITSMKVSAENILAVTFTNKAAEEMRNRLNGLLGGQATMPLVGTFHSICLKILEEIEGDNRPEVLDEPRRKSMVRDAIWMAKEKGSNISLKPDKVLKGIVTAKQQFYEPGDTLETVVEDISIPELRAVYQAYQDILSIEGCCDYEDLIFKVVARFKKDPILLKRYQDRFKYIFVDEYQDLNQGQYRLIRAFSPPKKDLFVIGDPDQSVYGFRGSNVEYFKKFMEDYPESDVVQLTRNYRSTKTILEASYQVIKQHQLTSSNMRVYSEMDGVRSIRILELSSEKAEAVAVGKTIENIVGGTGFHSVDFENIDASQQSHHLSFGDVAVFFRTGAQSEVFESVFNKAGIPFQTASKEKLFYIDGVLDLISLLKAVESSGTYADLEIITRRIYTDIGKSTLDNLKVWGYHNHFKLDEALWQARRIPIPEMSKRNQQRLYDFIIWLDGIKKAVDGLTVAGKIRYLSEQPSVRNILSDQPMSQSSLNQLIHISKDFGDNIRDFLAATALQTDTDSYHAKTEKVSLMTMHAAKGLEFPVVFIAGCEDGLIPHNRADTDLDEERRLFYVAMTRAKEQLYFTGAKNRMIFGKRVSRKLSPFVAAIETQLRVHETQKIKKSKKEKEDQIQLKLF